MGIEPKYSLWRNGVEWNDSGYDLITHKEYSTYGDCAPPECVEGSLSFDEALDKWRELEVAEWREQADNLNSFSLGLDWGAIIPKLSDDILIEIIRASESKFFQMRRDGE